MAGDHHARQWWGGGLEPASVPGGGIGIPAGSPPRGSKISETAGCDGHENRAHQGSGEGLRTTRSVYTPDLKSRLAGKPPGRRCVSAPRWGTPKQETDCRPHPLGAGDPGDGGLRLSRTFTTIPVAALAASLVVAPGRAARTSPGSAAPQGLASAL